ncbi:glutamate receptor ionotropic, kainate 2 [Zeugodacus cucurbitae]|uniref:Glutamate receptor, ionotropic kainate 2 n=1 Tax=Zeugodacus cucurbitae TaxID=28588 RepID=A0A0A1X1C2_ZEUCU|nr:glutamate receptor ionotropic, kainate 2 [Zeugodacus cucurbitae]
MWNYCLIVALTCLCVQNVAALPHINIGAIFYESELDLERIFIATVESINSEKVNNFKMVPLVRRVSESDGSMILQRQACDLIDNSVVSIFGPSAKADSDIVALICNATGIPHLQFDMSAEETEAESKNHQMTLNVFPTQQMLSKAYADIVLTFGWTKFTIVYDADDSKALTRLQDLIQLREIHNDVVRVRTFQRGDDYRTMWKSIKGERRIVLDCEPDLLVDLLNTSIEFKLTEQFNNLLLTNLETHNADLEELRGNETFEVNITATRLKMNGNFYYANAWQLASLYDIDPSTEQPKRTLLHDLLYDAVHVFANALRNVSYSYLIRTPRVRCDFSDVSDYEQMQPWPMGRYIYRVMLATSGVNNTDYRTSDLQFDDEGQRTNFGIEIYEPLENYGIAFWDTKGQITPQHIELDSTKKLVYRVATRLGEPYFMLNPEMVGQNVTGNELYMGYAVDLIDELSKLMNFEYIFMPVADNSYGKYDKETKQWDGIIGELINNNAHMGICDLTITQARRTVVDFTVPFMQLGVGILAYNEDEKLELLKFLEPFKDEVWICVIVAIFVISFLFVCSARLADDEWENPHPCNKDPDMLENKWGLFNTFYLTAASIMQAGCDILPKSAPFRTFTATWWIIAVIIPNSYTANLAAFLTSSKMVYDVSDLKSLVEQVDIKFGTIAGGSTYTLFAESNETVYRMAYNMMNNEDPSVYMKNNTEGVNRVIKNNGKYMFLMETTSLEYNTERNCKLSMIGEKFGEKHYAIAVPFGAQYRYNLSVNILKLSETGKLFELKDRWWKGEKNCGDEEEDNEALGFQHVRGIFYTLFLGLFAAYFLGIMEFLLHCHSRASEEKLRFKEVLVNEMRFVLRLWNNRKPVSCTPTASIDASSRRSSNRTTRSLTKKNSRQSSGSGEELRDLPQKKVKKNGSIIKEGTM